MKNGWHLDSLRITFYDGPMFDLKQLIDRKNIGKGAVVIAVCSRDDPVSGQHQMSQAHHDLEELSALLDTLGIATLERVVQQRDQGGGPYVLGRGKMKEVKELACELDARLLVYDSRLSGSQIRAIANFSGCQVVDREGVILEIFSENAATSVARLQIEMARLEYLMPRLVGAWSHLSRQAGGAVQSRGMGEKQVEVDRRIGRRRMAALKKKLDHIQVETREQRKKRRDAFKVALVGYTNSGKTTLMQGLTESILPGEDQLFATVSAKVKTMNPAKKPHILFTDTVGFIQRLPHSLIASFQATLAETIDADLCLHIVDISHPQYASHIATSSKVLAEIGAGDKQVFYVFNKTDKLEEPEFLRKIIQKQFPDHFWISARCDQDVTTVSEGILRYFSTYYSKAIFWVPHGAQEVISLIYEHCMISHQCYQNENLAKFEVTARPSSLKKIEKHLKELGGDAELLIENPPAKTGTLNQLSTASGAKNRIYIL
ncbi:MAG: GTPase HflX [Proteobacteria bacterium]|nr:GTPase HflX [Pseudomonadota bacterium]